jgi:hypothetical protein
MNPGIFAAGYIALLAPLLIHLLTRQTRRDISFPALRFIMEAMARQSRLFRIRHLLLLVVRTLIVLLLLLIFARPVFHAQRQAKAEASSTKPTIAAIILLDASASMRYHNGGLSLFNRGKASAERILGNLPPDALVNLIIAGRTAKSSYPELSPNHITVREDLHQAAPTFARASLRDAVSLAVSQLKNVDAVQRELYILSDYQRSNASDAGFDAIPNDIMVHHVPLSDAHPVNLSIERVEASPQKPGAGTEVEISCSIRAVGPDPVERRLELTVGPDVRIERNMLLKPGAIVTERFTFRIHHPGLYQGVVSVSDDEMSFDNRRYFVVNVVEKPLLVFVTDEPEERADSIRSLKMGIQPFAEATKGRYRFDVTRSNELLTMLYRKPFALVISGTRKWRDEEVARVARYFRDGGNVLWFLGGADDALNFNAMNQVDDDIRMPFLCRGHLHIPDGDRDGRERWFMANTEHPILIKLRDKYDFRRAQVYRRFATERQAGVGQIIATYGGGDAALAVVESLQGKLIAANFASGRSSGDIDRHMFWVPMLHEMLAWCYRRGADESPISPGDPVSMVLPAAHMTSSLLAFTPSGEHMAVTVGATGDDTVLVNLPEAEEPGFYSILRGDDPVMTVAVNVDPRESDLHFLDPEQIRQLSSDDNARVAATADEFDPEWLRQGHAWWPYLILLLLGCILAEQMIALVTRKDA